ncbi:ABC transporter permease [Salinibacterium sp. SYSU T00001]|uniref:ABC transporter permease n=1 Tax=Homoserinimonas sedimenticola TaxID=2986805 RepID=UPI002235D350|nr:ABC transporter permease [Salinibacterium sedimenticola]MCW4385671.1 ABC transporter permease [Salinibacterium sedimenticola]
MLKLILSRLALAVPQLLLLSFFVFLLTYLVPGSPAAAVLGAAATPESIARVEAQLGLDRPFFDRLVDYYVGAFQGDFGTSYVSARPVTELFAERLPATISLMAGGMVVTVIIGLGLGLIGGTKAGSLRDRIATGMSSFTMAVPEFWIGIVLVLVFAVQLRLVPVVSYVPIQVDPARWLQGIILPSIALGIAGAALIARQTRTAMAEAMAARYVDSLMAAGVSRRKVIFTYAFKNALVPVLSATGIVVSIMLGASFAIEKVFAFPGIGSLMLRSVTGKDFAVVQGGVLLIATMIILVNLILDISYGLINPKSRPQ